MIAGSRCLVTGGAGTIGSTVVDHLLDAGADQVIVVDNFTRGTRANLAAALTHPAVRLLDGDICDSALVDKASQGVDVVFHLAALRITQCAEQPRLAHQVLVDGTFNVVEAAAAVNAKVVLSSSASVYGMAEIFPTPETHHPYHNDTIYGAAKAYNEGLLRSYHTMYGLDYVALRYFNVYGPRMDVHGRYTEVLVRWIERIAAGQPPLILGDGQQTMDFVYTDDIARANVLAAEAPVTNQVINIGSGTETSLRALAELLLRVMNAQHLGVECGPPRPVNGISRRLADVGKAADLLGWHPRIGLEDGLRNLVDWWTASR
ncbi:NAD-dependent epimerase/dehydratase family protein [Nonomuraea sp. NPDC049400]|uniref:NAD-dependent epimerase/dehydratase family protein n=1 Tax=Nonomuraea sp. NPDC049400 TaxID=3364352 RepID=UPI00378D44B6